MTIRIRYRRRVLLAAVWAVLAAGTGAAAPEFPAETDLDVSLVTPVDERTTTASPELAFKLTRELKKDGVLLAPKNAVVTGRVTRVQKQASFVRGVKRNYYVVGLQIVSINTGEASVPVSAELETVGPTAMNDYFVPLSHGPDKWGEFEQYRAQFTIPPDPQPGESFLGVVRESLRVPKGLRMVFRTVGP